MANPVVIDPAALAAAKAQAEAWAAQHHAERPDPNAEISGVVSSAAAPEAASDREPPSSERLAELNRALTGEGEA